MRPPQHLQASERRYPVTLGCWTHPQILVCAHLSRAWNQASIGCPRRSGRLDYRNGYAFRTWEGCFRLPIRSLTSRQRASEMALQSRSTAGGWLPVCLQSSAPNDSLLCSVAIAVCCSEPDLLFAKKDVTAWCSSMHTTTSRLLASHSGITVASRLRAETLASPRDSVRNNWSTLLAESHISVSMMSSRLASPGPRRTASFSRSSNLITRVHRSSTLMR